jgi:hypothetical protein
VAAGEGWEVGGAVGGGARMEIEAAVLRFRIFGCGVASMADGYRWLKSGAAAVVEVRPAAEAKRRSARQGWIPGGWWLAAGKKKTEVEDC